MTDSIVTPLLQTSAFSDPLTKILRNGAQRFLATAVEEEVLSIIEAHASERLDDGQAHIVRHGHFLERDIQRRASGQYAFANRVCVTVRWMSRQRARGKSWSYSIYGYRGSAQSRPGF
jgi:hypothetical protein